MADDSSHTSKSESDRVVSGRYRVEEGVARGGFSTIYRARHVEMDRRIALKLLRLDEEVDPGVLERFSQEARLSSAIDHPNVVTIYEFGQDERGLLYIAMEWVEGESLKSVIDAQGALAPERVARIGRHVAGGLAAAHEQGILHRDLKPSNVMLSELPTGEEHAKILDFGIAKALDPPEEDQLRITHEGMFVGTPRYAAPEQIRGDELTPGTDIYGVGLLLWEAVVGEAAVPTVDFQECCSHHLSEDPWELPSDADCPTPLADVIHRALKKDPDERFESCLELAEALDEASQKLESAPPPSTASETGRYSQWSRVLFTILVGTAVVLLVAYPNWLACFGSGSTKARRLAAATENTDSPDALVLALEKRGWKVSGDSDAKIDAKTRLRVSRDGESVQLRFLPDASEQTTKMEDGELYVDFVDFGLVVSGDNGATAPFYRLASDLYELRATRSEK